MYKKYYFEKLNESFNVDTHKPKGEKYCYRCDICGVIIPSNISYPAQCGCGNIKLDSQMFRMSVGNYNKFSVLLAVEDN